MRSINAFWFALFLAIVLHSSSGVQSAFGQNNANGVSSAPLAVQPSEADSKFRFALEGNSQFGSYTYVPEHWGELHLRLENGADTPLDLLCTSYFGDQSTLQFGRQVWIPPKSRLSISHPVYLPRIDQLPNRVAEIHTLIIERSPGNETLVKSDSGQLRNDRSLLVTPVARNTGVIAGWKSTEPVPQDVLDLLIAARVNQVLDNNVTILSDQFLPADETSLNYLDHIVLAENRLMDDLAALTALRRWLHAGGRLWIMLDRVDPVLVEQLLGDDFQETLIDRVGLTSVRVDKAPSLVVPEGEPGETIDYEAPVELARTVASGLKVWNSVDGWPAALTGSYGAGRILLTTLGPRGWIKPAPPPPANVPTNSTSEFMLLSPMEDLAAYVLAKRDPDPLPQKDLESLAREFVAYTVPTWRLIVGMMSILLIVLFGLALGLGRSGRLEHFGWSGSLLALVFGGLFTGIGVSNRYSVPETISSVQLVQSIDGTDDVRSQGVLAVYRQEGNPAPVQTALGGRLWPDMTGTEGSVRRLITTDLGTFHWEGLPQPAGLRIYPEATSIALPDRIAAHATIDAQGLTGEFSGNAASGNDAILATRSGRVAVTANASREFTAAANDVLEVDQFLDASFLGDIQNRRRRILQMLFNSAGWKESLVKPQLLLWSDHWEHGFQFGEGLQPQGEALLSVPLQLTRPAAGTQMVIPSPLISLSTRRPPDGSLPAGCWDDSLGEWQERSSPTTTWLSCQVPAELLPIKATRARIDIKVSGPLGQLELLGVKNGTEFPLQAIQDPVGSLVLEIDDPDVLHVSADGQMALGVKAGEEQSTSPGGIDGSPLQRASYWKIQSLTLQLWATATEISAED